jgi:AraC-like DNA-binding protein/mannose-6-phosphate isomerase-like protein (cupin superfamily)
MEYNFLDREEYKDILILRMEDNMHGNLPFFIRRYRAEVFRTGLHRHEYMQINYVYQGKGTHYVRNHEFEIIKGDIFVIPPYIPHYITVPEDGHVEIFEFEFLPEYINQTFNSLENAESFLDFAYIEPFLLSENQIKPRLNISGKIQTEVEDLLNEALREYTERDVGFQLLIKSILLKLLVIVGREFKKDTDNSWQKAMYDRHKNAINSAMNYLYDNYQEDITLEQAAKRFSFSPSYFSYLFKSITSKTFTEYITGIRISKAMELLGSPDFEGKVLDLCNKVGFNNVNHFNRLFRLHTGVSPTQYRKKERKKL